MTTPFRTNARSRQLCLPFGPRTHVKVESYRYWSRYTASQSRAGYAWSGFPMSGSGLRSRRPSAPVPAAPAPAPGPIAAARRKSLRVTAFGRVPAIGSPQVLRVPVAPLELVVDHALLRRPVRLWIRGVLVGRRGGLRRDPEDRLRGSGHREAPRRDDPARLEETPPVRVLGRVRDLLEASRLAPRPAPPPPPRSGPSRGVASSIESQSPLASPGYHADSFSNGYQSPYISW